jgi:formate hydrogenlyase subunit 3/multisubunit Na+/H+ antiporter MnhD subunit
MNLLDTQRRALPLFTICIIFLLVAQYVVNENPWQHIFRLLALIVLAGGELMLLAGYRRGKKEGLGEKE